jgi:hypothetical protein
MTGSHDAARHMMTSRSGTRCCVDTQARSRSFREPAVQARRTGTAAPRCRSRRSDQISSPTIRHAECLGGHSNAEPFSGSLAMKGSIPGSVARGSKYLEFRPLQLLDMRGSVARHQFCGGSLAGKD